MGEMNLGIKRSAVNSEQNKRTVDLEASNTTYITYIHILDKPDFSDD